jgi:hypothetical protein
VKDTEKKLAKFYGEMVKAEARVRLLYEKHDEREVARKAAEKGKYVPKVTADPDHDMPVHQVLRSKAWYCKVAAGGLEVINTLCPPGCKVTKDDLGGYYIIKYPHEDYKYVSWTNRGERRARIDSVHVAWALHELHSGFGMPESVRLSCNHFMITLAVNTVARL